jgi:flagellar motor switch protein FliG
MEARQISRHPIARHARSSSSEPAERPSPPQADPLDRDRLYKSAVLLLTLGTEVAARVLSQMDERHVESLIAEMTRLGRVRADEQERVVAEFSNRLEDEAGTVAGGPEYAKRLLAEALGPERADQLMPGDTSGEHPSSPLQTILATTSPTSLAALVADEHPQLIALLAGQMRVENAAELLAALPGPLQGAVTARLAELETPAPLAIEHLERCLLAKLEADPSSVAGPSEAGPRRVADILSRMRRSVETLVLASLEQESPVLAQRVNRYRFTIENLLELEPRTLQRVIRDIEAETLRLAMKGLDEEQQQIILSNMSERAAIRLKEDLDGSGPTQLRDVEMAQQTILGIARALQESGEIQIHQGEEESSEEQLVV